MGSSTQLCGLLLYALCSSSLAQSVEIIAEPQERTWHSTTPGPIIPAPEIPPLPETTPLPEPPTTAAPVELTLQPEIIELLLPEVQQDLQVVNETELDASSVEKILEDILDKNETEPTEKPRTWMSVPVEEQSLPEQEVEIVQNTQEPPLPDITEDILQALNSTVLPEEQEQHEDEYSMNKTDFELPKNITDMLAAAEEGEEMVQETIISKKTTVYVTISDALGDAEPVLVNLTGIRDFAGLERRIIGGCLDLSDLDLNGEEVKEVLQRMSKHKFHKLNLSNNKIREFPTNTFSPVAFSVRELRLDHNPLQSNGGAETSMLQRGGLFHLTELRELNLSSCGLLDIDYFTPWNSNRLEVVDISANNLHSVPSNLQFFHKLKKLFLDGNPITHVTELPFALLWNIHVLSLSGCLINSISSDPFRNMEHLKQLSLEGNNLTRIGDVRLPRSSSGVKLYLSGNPWHCACDMLNFVEYHHYAIRDIEELRCATPRWLEGLRTAYLTKEILSLDSVDADCTPTRFELPTMSVGSTPVQYPLIRTDRLEFVSLVVFALAAIFMMLHILCSKKSKDKYKFDEELRQDINYIRIDRKPSFK